MPLRSKRQARWMFANHPDMAHRWAHHTPGGIKKLPESVGEDKKERAKAALAQVVKAAAERQWTRWLVGLVDEPPRLPWPPGLPGAGAAGPGAPGPRD